MRTIIETIEQIILKWDDTSIGNGDFGTRTFLFHQKEFGHIHPNADLDIEFGKNITDYLLSKRFVQKHGYVPETNITYPVLKEENIPFAIALLKLAYLLHSIKKCGNNNGFLERALSELPESLSSIIQDKLYE